MASCFIIVSFFFALRRGESLDLRPLRSSHHDAALVSAGELHGILVESNGHVAYLGQQLAAGNLSLQLLSEVCLHLASIQPLSRDQVALLALVRKGLTKAISLSKPGKFHGRLGLAEAETTERRCIFVPLEPLRFCATA